MTDEVAAGQVLLAGKGVAPRQDSKEWHLRQDLGRQVLARVGVPGQGHVEPAAAQRPQLLEGVHGPGQDAQVGVARGQGGQGDPGQLGPEVGDIAELQLVGVAVGDPPADFQRVPGLSEGVAGLGDECLADRGQLDPPAGPLEQGPAELPLQPLDLFADGLLGDVQPCGRAAEVPLVGDRDRVLQLAQLHHDASVAI